jgi:hypothetical protein
MNNSPPVPETPRKELLSGERLLAVSAAPAVGPGNAVAPARSLVLSGDALLKLDALRSGEALLPRVTVGWALPAGEAWLPVDWGLGGVVDSPRWSGSLGSFSPPGSSPSS